MIFTGTLNENGYGLINYQGRTYGCHRLSAVFFLNLNIFDESLQANHKPECESRACWIFEHLYIGTQSNNIQDIIKAGNHNQLIKTHCPQGHEYTKENTYITKKNFRMCRICKNASSKNAKSRGV